MQQDNVFAELKAGRSSLKYMQNGKLRYSGPKGHILFVATMNHAGFFGHGNPLPAMVAVSKLLDNVTITINDDAAPETPLSKLNYQLQEAQSPAARADIKDKIEQAKVSAPENDWSVAKKMMNQGRFR
jgi:hypothetical protein